MHQVGTAEIAAAYGSYLKDESKLAGGRAERLFFPENEAEVAAALSCARDLGLAVTVSGGRTGIVGGAVPFGGGLLSLERMRRILALVPAEGGRGPAVRLQPGITLAELAQELKAGEPTHYYPVDPTEDNAQIGGTVATNASGGRSYHYGPTRDYVQALRVALADGTILALRRGEHLAGEDGGFGASPLGGAFAGPAYRRPEVKNAAGYFSDRRLDLIDLFIGSEGTLGVVTEVELALAPKPEAIVYLMVFCPQLSQAFELVARAQELEAEQEPLAIEFFDAASLDLLRAAGTAGLPRAAAAVLLEVGASMSEMEAVLTLWDELITACGIPADQTWVEEEGAAKSRLSRLRHLLPETVNGLIAKRQADLPGLHKVSTDFAVPRPYLRQLHETYESALDGLEHVVFGHIGDSHLHANVLPKDLEELRAAKDAYLEIARWVVSIGGTVSAEHGIGKLKREMLALMYGEAGLAEMRRIKAYFDPEGRLNPGVMF